MATTHYKAQVLQLRESTIVSAVNRLLARKGYDLMTVDEVAAEAGMAKASLYKHFTSKEDLAGAAMVRVLTLARDEVARIGGSQEGQASALDHLKDVARWAMQTQLKGEMPSLPTQNSALTQSLQHNKVYMDHLFELSNQLGAWITAAQEQRQINPQLPPELVLYTLFACACNPVLGLMKASGAYTDTQIVEWMVQATFGGLGPTLGL